MEGVNEKENEEVEAQKHSGPSELGKWAEYVIFVLHQLFDWI